jgi:hypothetical protein
MSSSYDWILVVETPGHIEICLEKECPILQKCVIKDLCARPRFIPGKSAVLCAVD